MSRYRKSMGETMAEVEKIGQELPEVSPPGWKGSVKAMKKHKDIDNPWALAWHMKNKGDKPHYKDQDGKPEKKAKYKNEEIDTVGVVQLHEEVELDEKHDCDEVHPDVSHEDWVDQKDEDMSLAPKGKGRKAAKALYQGKVDEWGNSPLDQAIPKHLGRPDLPKKKEKKEEVELAIMSLDHKESDRKLKITQKGLDALRKDRDKRAAEPKVSITKKGLLALKKAAEGLDLKKIRAQRRAKAAKNMKDVEKVFNKKAKPTKDMKVPPRYDDPDRGHYKGIGEDVKIDELSTDLLGKYKTKAAAQSSAAAKAGDHEKSHKRYKGINRATTLQFRNDARKHDARKEEVEMEEMQFKVKLKGLPSFYVPSKSAATVKAMLRKQMRRPDDIESIDRVTKSAKKRDFRLRVQGKEQDGE